jgi:serine/threonine-protein kinase
VTPERWAEIEALFDACLPLGPQERQALLAERAADDPELRAEVESLLGHDATVMRLDGIVERSAQSALPRAGEIGPGMEVGPYRLERCLGEGGMGSVWLAARADEEFEHRVAIKFVGAASGARGLDERFRSERQILAALEHPHIARLLGGGSTDRGEPYLVMEYVDGEPLMAFCDRRRLGLDERLELFRRICGAVEHAHRRLIVHRDLKPANILVHPETGPKLLDFGIAKLLGPAEGPGAQADLTRPHDRLLTPDYASPEQIMGQPVTTASDVYSLGILLFELLTGQRPRRLGDLGAAARERAVTEGAATRPSVAAVRPLHDDDPDELAARRGLRPPQLARRLRGDLDTIAAKAMHVEPERRYAGVAELAADVGRHLDGRPVTARPDSWRYRAGKLCRRSPLGVTAAGLLLALVVAFVVGQMLSARRLAAERDRALAAETESGAVSGFLMELFQVADPSESRGDTVTARDLLDRGGERIATELEGQPAVQSALLETLADVHLNLGLVRRAAELHRQALERRRELWGDEHLETARSRDRLGDTLRQLSRFAEAEAELRRALEIRRAQLPADDPRLADSLNNLGLLLMETGRREEAEPMLRQALDIRLRALGPEHPDTNVSRSNLGQLLTDQSRYEEAEPILREALRIRRRLFGENHPKTANSIHVLATMLKDAGRFEEAEPLLRRAVEIRREVLGPTHSHLGASINNLAFLYHDQLRLSEAEPLYRETLAIDAARGGEPRLADAFTLNNLAELLEDLGRYREAEELYRRSLAIRARLLGEESASYRRVLGRLGRATMLEGDLETAARHLERACGPEWGEADAAADVSCQVFLAMLERRRGDVAAARARLGGTLARFSDRVDDRRLGRVHLELAWTLAAAETPGDCLEPLEAARVRLAEVTWPLDRARLDLAAGVCHAAVGEAAAARRALRAVIDRLEPNLGPANALVADARRRLDALGDGGAGIAGR